MSDLTLIRPLFCRLMLLAAAQFASGCQMFGDTPAAAPPPLPAIYNVSLSMEKFSNLSASGTALPLKVRMFGLKNSSVFMSEDFFTLQRDGPSSLNGELISQQQLFLRPGQKPVSVRIEKTRELRFIGLVAEYQQLDGKRWRQVVPLADPEPLRRSLFNTLFSARPASPITEISIVATQRGLTSVVSPKENN